jgi:hypothetical protein
MIAYNKDWLRNLALKKEMEGALAHRLVGREEYERTIRAFPAGFYTPNPFIRIGLFLLTGVICVFAAGIFFLAFEGSQGAVAAVAVFLGGLAYLALEMVIRNNHYHSGVDGALLYLSLIFIFTGIVLATGASGLGGSFILFTLSLYLCIRFVNAGMGVISFIAFLRIVLFTASCSGPQRPAVIFLILLPFVLAVLILSGRKWKTELYARCIAAIHVSALFCLYAIGNIFILNQWWTVMKELTPALLNPFFSWLFWAWTIFIPVLYIVRGLLSKEPAWYRSGLLLLPAAVLTVRYYHPLLAPEIAMILAGSMLVVVAAFFNRRLKKPKNGYTSAEILPRDKTLLDTLSFAGITNAMHPGQQDAGTTRFGGGSGGGGGAGGDF